MELLQCTGNVCLILQKSAKLCHSGCHWVLRPAVDENIITLILAIVFKDSMAGDSGVVCDCFECMSDPGLCTLGK